MLHLNGIQSNENGLLSRERSEHLLQSLHVRIAAEYATTIQAPVRQIAACMADCRCCHYNITRHSIGRLLCTGAAHLVAAAGKPAVKENTLITYINKELTPQSLTLPDGSVIKVWPGSGISYYDQFAATSREHKLER